MRLLSASRINAGSSHVLEVSFRRIPRSRIEEQVVTRHAALLLTFATGASGRVYRVTWERYLAALVGSHGEAAAAVLGLFLGGLAGGYALFGALTRRGGGGGG